MGSPDLTGILNVNKPLGWTSHDAVARIRRLAKQKRVGHAGTLDPLASGVLPVLLGRATRLADYIQSGRKTYVASVKLGEATETDDAEGAVTGRLPVPELSDALLEDVLNRFRGDILQKPPKYSALKVAGQRAYAMARRGQDVDLAERPITIDELRLLDYSPGMLQLEVTCHKGTYIRALARDIAAELGTLGHLAALSRTRVGPFDIGDALKIEDLASADLANAVLPPCQAIPEAPSFNANVDEAVRLRNGQAIPTELVPATSVWIYDPDGQLLCLASIGEGLLKPRFAL